MKMTSHERLVQTAIKAIGAINSDTSVDCQVTLDDLCEIAGDIEIMKEAIRETMRAERGERRRLRDE